MSFADFFYEVMSKKINGREIKKKLMEIYIFFSKFIFKSETPLKLIQICLQSKFLQVA